MLEWFVLRTHWAQEQRAERELSNQKIRTFLPLARTEHRRSSDGLLIAKLHPLFPRYLFVQLRWDDHRPVTHTRGVQSFVGYYEGMTKAPTVPKDDIKELKSRLQEILGRDVVLMGRPGVIEPGALVRVLFGAFKDHVGTVKSLQGSRAEVLMDLFGITTPVKLPRDILSREGVTRIVLDQAA